ncbi:hypothetical protein D3C78_1290030 [compost metagenome]
MRAIHPGIGQPQTAKNIPEHAIRTKGTKMPGVAYVDDIGRPCGKPGKTGPHGVQCRFRFTQNLARLFGPPELFTKRGDRRQRLFERRLTLHVKGQRKDGGDRFQPAGITCVERRNQNELRPGELQKLEIRSTAQAEIGDGFRDIRLDRAGPELDEFGRRHRHDAERHRCFQHGPVDGGDARRHCCPRLARKSRSGEQA